MTSRKDTPPPPPPAGTLRTGAMERPVFGLFSSQPKIGIVGMPRVGKSILFHGISKLPIPQEIFLAPTIQPTVAHVTVPNEQFDWLCQFYNPESKEGIQFDIIDTPGLVRASHAGEGQGNAFLTSIRDADLIFHIIRAFEDDEIRHVDDMVDPVRDLDTVSEELRLKDVEYVEEKIEELLSEKLSRRSNDKQITIQLELCHRLINGFKDGKDVRIGQWEVADLQILNSLKLLTAKPVVYLVNVSEKDLHRERASLLTQYLNECCFRLARGPTSAAKELVSGVFTEMVQKNGGGRIVPLSCAFEQKLVGMLEDEAVKYCVEHQLTSMIPKIVQIGFEVIDIIYFFTANAQEVKCWQVRRQTKAPQAAGAIHPSLAKGFIHAEVMKFEDVKELGSIPAVMDVGKYRKEGNAYVVQDGDIILFKSYLSVDEK